MTTRRQEDKEKRRREILDAAVELYAARGVENVSYADIAARTGLSRSLIYFYYPEAQALFLSAVLDSCQRLHQRFLKALSGPHTGLEQVEALGRAYLQFHQENPAHFALFAFHEARRGDRVHPVEESIHFHKDAIMRLVEEALRRGVEDGSVSKQVPQPEILSFCLWAFTHGLAQVAAMKGTMLANCGLSETAVVEAGFDFLRCGLRS
jgi:AcrR family transcriptional regulator